MVHIICAVLLISEIVLISGVPDPLDELNLHIHLDDLESGAKKAPNSGVLPEDDEPSEDAAPVNHNRGLSDSSECQEINCASSFTNNRGVNQCCEIENLQINNGKKKEHYVEEESKETEEDDEEDDGHGSEASEETIPEETTDVKTEVKVTASSDDEGGFETAEGMTLLHDEEKSEMEGEVVTDESYKLPVPVKLEGSESDSIVPGESEGIDGPPNIDDKEGVVMSSRIDKQSEPYPESETESESENESESESESDSAIECSKAVCTNTFSNNRSASQCCNISNVQKNYAKRNRELEAAENIARKKQSSKNKTDYLDQLSNGVKQLTETLRKLEQIKRKS